MDGIFGTTGCVSTTLADWFATPLGRYLLAREQAYFDQTVADIFGFHAVQIGLPHAPLPRRRAASRRAGRSTTIRPPNVLADPHGLPFAENALDLIVMPHALEFTDDPHLMLREAYRVIRPEGQIVIAGFNPFSLFGAKRYFGRGATPPWNGNFIALYRLKDWLSLLGFDVVGGRLDGYVPPFAQESWLHALRLFRAGGRSLVADLAAACTTCARPRRCSACALLTPAWQRRERRKKALVPAARARESATSTREHVD